MTQENSSPKWFLIVSIVALIWNLLGLMAFVSQITMTAETIAQLPAAEQALYQNIPLWATAAFAIAVGAGTLACIVLLMKKSMAKIIFIASLIGVLVQNFHSFFVIDAMAVYGVTGIIMPLLVIVIGVALIMLSQKAIDNQWIN